MRRESSGNGLGGVGGDGGSVQEVSRRWMGNPANHWEVFLGLKRSTDGGAEGAGVFFGARR